MKLLVTGGAGFIGANFIRYVLAARQDVEVVNLDKLTYAGNLENLERVDRDPRYRFVRADISEIATVEPLVGACDAVINFAAESHVDRSIQSDYPFIRSNVLGVQTLLAACLNTGGRRFVQISTDEVYGELPWRDPAHPASAAMRQFAETDALAPRSPYAASKAAADHLVLAYVHTHGLEAIITRSGNNYGPYQFPEKLVPLVITNALEGKRLPVYGDGLHVRDWIHVRDHCRGIEAALFHGRPGEIYNFGARAERTNLQVVRDILRVLGLSEGLIEFVEDRPGHDRRYALDPAKAERELGWRAEMPFELGLKETIHWYQEHTAWWQHAKSGEYLQYYKRMYGPSRGRRARRISRASPS